MMYCLIGLCIDWAPNKLKLLLSLELAMLRIRGVSKESLIQSNSISLLINREVAKLPQSHKAIR